MRVSLRQGNLTIPGEWEGDGFAGLLDAQQVAATYAYYAGERQPAERRVLPKPLEGAGNLIGRRARARGGAAPVLAALVVPGGAWKTWGDRLVFIECGRQRKVEVMVELEESGGGLDSQKTVYVELAKERR